MNVGIHTQKLKLRFGIFTEKDLGRNSNDKYCFVLFFNTNFFFFLVCVLGIHMYGDKRTICRSPSTPWIPGMKLRSSFISKDFHISLALFCLFVC